jgi:putative endonuclease
MDRRLSIDCLSKGSANLTIERIQLGRLGEDLAFKKIKSLGYKCIARNYRCSLGEIDLIAKDGEYLVFIEIKTRRGKSIEYAKEAVDKHKMRQISKVALYYMKENNCWDMKSRFDVVAIRVDQGMEDVQVIPNAFELAY